MSVPSSEPISGSLLTTNGLRRSSKFAALLAVVTLGVFAFSTSGFYSWHADKELRGAYNVLDVGHQLPDRATAVTRLEDAHLGKVFAPLNHVLAYQEVRATHGPAIAIAALTPNRVVLIGRSSGTFRYQTVGELTGGRVGASYMATLWAGKFHWAGYWQVLVDELIGLGSLGLLWGLWVAGSDWRARRRRKADDRRRLERWREYVPSPSIGPSAPKSNFSVWVPELHEAKHGTVTFTARLMHWQESGSWKADSHPSLRRPDKLNTVVLPAGMQFAEISAGWADFCAAIIAENSRAWEQLAAEEAAALEQRAEEETLLRLQAEQESARRPLDEVLPSGPQMIRELTASKS